MYWYASWRRLEPEEYGLKAARALEAKILELGAENVAAFIGGRFRRWRYYYSPSTYWPERSASVTNTASLLVADEVICGGRTGEWFGSQYFWHPPAPDDHRQGLSSGYLPIGGVLVHDQVAKALIEAGDFNHGFYLFRPPGGRRRNGREPAHPEKRTYHRAHARRDGAVCPSGCGKTPCRSSGG